MIKIIILFIIIAYETIANGTSVGNKRIEILADSVKTSSILFTVTSSIDTPIISKLAVYQC